MSEKMYKNTPDGKVELTEEETNELIKWREKENKRLADTKWIRDRQADYPSWQEQMDLIYHSGVAGLKAELKKTKEKFTKE